MVVQLKRENKPGRNEPCPCQSGLKYKDCHGDLIKQETCNQIVNEVMLDLIYGEKVKKGLICRHGVLKGKHCNDCKMGT